MAITDPASTTLRKAPLAASLIGENMTLEGAITAEGELQVDGVIRGEVRVSRLVVGECGQIEGSVVAETIDVRGKVIGALTAKHIRLATSAHVEGDMTHEQVAIEAGAFFEGRSLKFQRPATPVVAAKPAEKAAAPKDLLPPADEPLRPQHVS